jgi:hypothetical protein
VHGVNKLELTQQKFAAFYWDRSFLRVDYVSTDASEKLKLQTSQEVPIYCSVPF